MSDYKYVIYLALRMGPGVNKAPSILAEGHGPKDLIGRKSTAIFEPCKPKQRLIVHMSLQGTCPIGIHSGRLGHVKSPPLTKEICGRDFSTLVCGNSPFG